MPIEITCSNCQAILRVAEEHAGKSARCPQCSTVVPIPLTPLPPENSWQEQPTQHHSPQFANSGQNPNPYATPTGDPRSRLLAHRGPTILILAIVSFLCCCLIGIAAIIMANEDLRQMDAGVMNNEGRGLTVAGKIIAIVALILNAIGLVLQLLMLGFAAAAAPMGM